ncbi:MAG: glycosyltransferase [bacterium]|nr:glycosyltransferase [bacterium]
MNKTGCSSWFTLHPGDSPHWRLNLDECRRRDARLAERVDNAASRLAEWEFIELGVRQYSARPCGEGAPLYPLDRFLPALQGAFDRARLFYQRGAALLIVAGSGLNYLASHLEDMIRGDFRLGVIVAETRAELIAAQFHLFDARPLLQSHQVFWAVGDPLQAEFAALLERESLYNEPPARLAVLPERALSPEESAAFRSLPQTYAAERERLMKEYQSIRASFQQTMQRPPDLRSGAAWAFLNPDAYAHTPLMKSMLDGLAELGMKKTPLSISDGFASRFQLAEHITRAQPDLMLFCNSASSGYVNHDLPRPRATLMLDNPQHYSPEALREELGPRDCVFYFDRTWKPFFETTHAGAIQFMPAYSTFTRPGAAFEDLRAPIVFVGSHTPVAEYLVGVREPALSQLRAAAEYKIANPCATYEEIVLGADCGDEAAARLIELGERYTGAIQRPFTGPEARADYFLYALANSVKRERYVGALADLGIVVYGPDSWRGVLGESRAAQVKGWIDSSELPCVYASADLCLNIHSLQCPTCFNVRDFDALAAGACLLGDFVADMNEGLLTPGEDFVMYNSPGQLRELAMVLLENRELRRSIAAAGNETYKARHTPRHRAQALLDGISALPEI